MKRNWWPIVIGFLIALYFILGNKAKAEERLLNLELRPGWVREYDARKRRVNLPGENKEPSVVKNPCADIGYTLWVRSAHPGGDKNGKLNQNNLGLGFKCFFGKEHPYFAHLDAITDSWRGSSLTAGFGKRLDLVDAWKVHVYVGGAISATAYEIPTKGMLFFVMPTTHKGIGYDLPWELGVISVEEQRLLGGIKLRSLGWQLRKSF